MSSPEERQFAEMKTITIEQVLKNLNKEKMKFAKHLVNLKAKYAHAPIEIQIMLSKEIALYQERVVDNQESIDDWETFQRSLTI